MRKVPARSAQRAPTRSVKGPARTDETVATPEDDGVNDARALLAEPEGIADLDRHRTRHGQRQRDIARVLAIPPRRCDRTIVSFLTADEIEMLLAAPDRDRWHGRRDHALLTLAYQTGLRVSELTALTGGDVTSTMAHTCAATAKAASSVIPR